jgi:hypothetical protein
MRHPIPLWIAIPQTNAPSMELSSAMSSVMVARCAANASICHLMFRLPLGYSLLEGSVTNAQLVVPLEKHTESGTTRSAHGFHRQGHQREPHANEDLTSSRWRSSVEMEGVFGREALSPISWEVPTLEKELGRNHSDLLISWTRTWSRYSGLGSGLIQQFHLFS